MKTLLIIILMGLCGCITSPYQSSSITKSNLLLDEKSSEVNIHKEGLLENWRTDTLGCLGHRNLETIQFIIDTLGIKGKPMDFVIEKLGYPNTRKPGINSENFYYFFETTCQENALIDSVDFCWMELLFKFDRVTNIDISCF